MNKNKIILVQPTMGISGEFVCHIPLSLLYVASGLLKRGFEVEILDNRLYPYTWRERLLRSLTDEVLLVGVTVMTGSPIANAIEVSKIVKSTTNIPLIWGGAHTTILPEQILEKEYVDYTISGSGVGPMVDIVLRLRGDKRAGKDFCDIPGLGYKEKGEIHVNTPYQGFEVVPYRDIPYHLIEDFSLYGQIGSKERIFPIYSSYGCPYKCSFCAAAMLYKDFRKKWLPLPTAEVVDHIEYLKREFGATQIYFYDDDSFIEIEHVNSILEAMRRRNLRIKMGFRGARVNEIMKMDQDYLNELANAGACILHIGIESGSQRILNLLNKGIKVEDILEINRKLAQNQRIIAAYNWIIGIPTETLEDIQMTRDMILSLIAENPRCLIFVPNKFRPLPGVKLTELAIAHGYKYPSSLEEWISEETEGSKSLPWYTPKMEKMIRMLQVTSYFIDHKTKIVLEDSPYKLELVRLLTKIYRPLARMRFKYGISSCLLEYPIYQFAISRYHNR